MECLRGGSEEALKSLNKDPWNHPHFYTERLGSLVQAGTLLVNISPRYAIDYLPVPFSNDLRPGQAIAMVTHRVLWCLIFGHMRLAARILS